MLLRAPLSATNPRSLCPQRTLREPEGAEPGIGVGPPPVTSHTALPHCRASACLPACLPAEHVGKSQEEVRGHFLATYIEHEGAPLPRREPAMQGVSVGDWRGRVLVGLGRRVPVSRCAKHAAEHGMPGGLPAAGCPALRSGVPAQGLCRLSTSGRPGAHPCFPSHCTPAAGGH